MDAILQKIEPKILNFVMAGIALLLAAGIIFSLVIPKVKEYRAGANAREILQDAARTSGSLESQLAGMEEEIEKLRHDLHGDMIDLPAKQLEAFIIGRLQEISWSHRVELNSVRPSKGQMVQIFQELLFDVEVTGSYFDVFDWIRELGDKLGFVVIKQYAIRPVRTDSAEPQLSVRLTMVSYRKA